MGDESPGSASHRSFSDTSSKRKQKKRVRNWTASDRARHRVFEKGRREAFNERLMDLAHLLPTLSNAKESQLSKHVIVDESVKYHQTQLALIESLRQDLDKVLAEHQQLLAEANVYRQYLDFSSTGNQAIIAGSQYFPPIREQSMLLSKTPLAHPAHGPAPSLGQDSNGAEGEAFPIFSDTIPTESQAFQLEGSMQQLSSSLERTYTGGDVPVDCAGAFEAAHALNASAKLTDVGALTEDISEGLCMEGLPATGLLDAFDVPIYSDGYWIPNP